MFSSLRTRLLTSYLLLLTVTLSVMLVALFVATSAQPSPPQPTYQRLAALARGINLTDLIIEFTGQRRGSPDLDNSNIMTTLLDNFADTRNVRVMIINLNQQAVLYDSGGNFAQRDYIDLNFDSYQADRYSGANAVFGGFRDAGGEWLFSGVTNQAPISAGRLNNYLILVADLRPTQSLQSVLGEFDTSLAVPLLQAGGIGLFIAIFMAYAISRTIARPLQAASEAATAVAEGDLNQGVPVSGPAEVRAVAEAFNSMSAEVRATQQAQRDFMANVSHDLKTPLTSIQGYSQAIMDGAARDPVKAAAIIHDEASRLTRMVMQLTDLARMEAGQLSMNMTPLDAGSLAKNVAQSLTVNAEQKGVRLKVNAPPMPDIDGDGDRLVQVLQNLIGNAIKFTPAGGTVRVLARGVPGAIELIVADSGVGIPRDDLPRVFERFYQVDKARGPQRGTGLGLAITHEIINAHGGRISVSSELNKGTVFTIWLPVRGTKHTTQMSRHRLPLNDN
ncbi:MAG: HAMP domain-containing sensor histidine kinase [Aggregatilineales bacterium]